MRRKNISKSSRAKKIIALSILTMFSAISLVTSTIAWFSDGTNVSFGQGSKTPVVAGTEATYFGGGNGTSGSPFIISNRTHLYNLAWLQYIGYFDGTNANQPLQPYFILSDNIDMTGMTLPPIGTEVHPFIGNFDGNNKTISNLTVSNADPTSSTDFGMAKPSNLVASTNPEIVGFFGVVGKYTLTNLPNTFDSSIIEMKNLTLNGLTVKSKTTETLIGLAAGYVDGTMSGVKLSGKAELDVSGQSHTAISSITDKVSDYGLVGYSKQTVSSGTYAQDLSEFYRNTLSDDGGGSDWGGSINMRSLNNRLWNLLNAPNDVKTDDPATQHPTHDPRTSNLPLQGKGKTIASYYNYHRYYYDDYNYVTVENAASETSSNNNDNSKDYNNKNPETNANIYRLASEGTYAQNAKDNSSSKTITVPGTILPLAVGEKTNGYSTLSRNTGYIISGMAGGTGSYTAQTTIRVASSPIGAHIGNSLSSSGTSSTGYTQSQLEVITTNNAGTYNANNFTRIKDSYNESNTSVSSAMSSKYSTRGVQASDLAKYNSARDQLDEVLADQSFTHGLHFTGSSATSSNTVTMPSAVFNGATYTNYAMPKNSIDFKLKEAGYINFFAGSYQHNTTTTCDSFFSLNIIKRNSSNAITSISEISKIYNNTNSSTKDEFPYVYELTSGSNYAGMKNGSEVTFTKGSTVLFDMQYLWNAPGVNYAIYYFEVPVNAGEFAMGSHSGKDKGTYLLYLDLSASGQTENIDKVTAYSITTKTSGSAYPKGVDFAVANVGSNGGETFGVYIPTSSNGVVSFTVNNTGTSVAINDANSISTYSFQGSKYGGSEPGSGQFSVTGASLPAAMPSPTVGGVRVLNITIIKLDGSATYHIEITDYLTDAAGSYNEANSIYLLDGNTSGRTAILGLSSELNATRLATLRSLNKAATLTRDSGTGEFVVVYDAVNCSYVNKIVDVDIDLNGTTISIGVTSGYRFKIGGTQYSDGSTYPNS